MSLELPPEILDDPIELARQEYEQKYPQELRNCLKSIKDQFEIEQKPAREFYIKEWKLLDYYWRNVFDIYWSEVAHDWRPYEEGIRANKNIGIDTDEIGRSIGVYRAYGESIIAALSTGVPGVRFAPDDADNPDDVSTAKAYGKISDLIDIANDAKALIIKALFILWNQPCVFAYNYHNTDPSYGMVKVPKIETEIVDVEKPTCPQCLGDIAKPDNISGLSLCSTCESLVAPETEVVQETRPVFPSYDLESKGREIIEIYGPMNVKVPFYIQNLKNSPYLGCETEHHYTLAQELFPQIKDKIKTAKSGASSQYDRYARTPSDKFHTEDYEVVTIGRWWFRPWAYNLLEEDKQEELRERYPNGCFATFVDDIFADAIDENMDDHWTVSASPTSSHIHDIPMGRTLIDVQDMTNEMVNLVLRTIKHGIPTTFADSDAIDWDKFQNTPAEPGDIFPARPSKSGTTMAGRFHTVKTATLSQEVQPFMQWLQGQGQFVSKAFPSIYGGPQVSGSKTYKEYEMSRNQALQALGLVWQNLNVWWKDVKMKACREYAKNVRVDEQYSKDVDNSFINVWIRRSELQGKVGNAYPESSDQFPISSQQKRGLLIELIGMNNDFLNQAIFNIENAEKNSRLLSFDELYIPGLDQRNKQVRETSELAKSQPIPTGQPDPNDPTGMTELMTSSVPIEPFDENNIHMQCTAAFLVSEVGQALKVENPAGYQNVVLHYQEHAVAQQAIDMQNMQMQLQQQKMTKPLNNQVDDGSEKVEQYQ